MSFVGSINAETRKWLGNNGPAFDGRQVYIGCSGNFTVEQLISRYAPKARIWDNDVSLYSGALGAYLADQPFNLGILSASTIIDNQTIPLKKEPTLSTKATANSQNQPPKATDQGESPVHKKSPQRIEN